MADLSGGIEIVEGNVLHDSVDDGAPVKIGGYASTSPPAAVSADVDRVNAWFDRNGRFMVSLAVRLDPTNDEVAVSGKAAHDAAVAGNPVLLGGEARDVLGTIVAQGDTVRLVADRYGRLRLVGPELTITSSDNTPVTTATDTAIVAAPGAGKHLLIYYVHASNGGATATDVAWRDDVAGARRYRTTLPQYGVFAHNFKPGVWRLTSNKALYLYTSATGSVHWTAETEIADD